MKVLGLDYGRKVWGMELSAPEAKLDKTVKQINELKICFAKGAATTKMIEELLGNLIYVTYLSSRRRANWAI